MKVREAGPEVSAMEDEGLGRHSRGTTGAGRAGGSGNTVDPTEMSRRNEGTDVTAKQTQFYRWKPPHLHVTGKSPIP